MKENHATLFQMETPLDCLVARYRELTMQIMPKLARTSHAHWPVNQDHCFQRIVLDNICDGIWYDHIKKPAYKHMSEKQAEMAVKLCERIIDNTVNLHTLNAQSLQWRTKTKLNRKI